ncbi:MAG TPA: sulfite exporter TauE/SafE family protein, partial [Alkalispirochaeta sp.]|nr:sulfite exporter TauE/SafE family protein [Alkalispirochaeta sp.]
MGMNMELGTVVVLTAIYSGAGIVQGLVGFGFAILSVPLVAILYGPGAAVAMNVVVGTALLAYKAWLQRGDLDRRAVFTFGGATLLFIPVGVLVISALPREPALALIGVFVVAVAASNLVSRHHVRRAAGTPLAFWGLAGISGILAGAFSAPGPSAVPYFTARAERPLTAQANLQLYFLILGVPVI